MNREFKISLSQECYSDVIYLSQYDDDYSIVLTVLNKYSLADISGYSYQLEGTRPDGLGFTLPGTVSGSKVTVPIDTTLTACAGASIAELVIYDGNGFRFGSANVQIIVEPAAHPDSVIDADEDTIRGLAAEVQEIVDTAAAEVKGEAEAWAVGQRDGEDVPSTDPTYENNAKYYAEQAAASASSGLTAEIKAALLACFRAVAWRGDVDAGDLYYALDTALNPPANLSSISAVYTQSGTVDLYDSLESLRSDLVVTAHYTDNTSAVVTSYTLSGTLTLGTSTITVTYGGKSTTFTVTVTSEWDYVWDLTNSLTDTVGGVTAVASAGEGVDPPAITSGGLVFNAATQRLSLGDINLDGKTIEIDVASFDFKGSTASHMRFVVWNSNSGPMIFHKDNGWSAYGLPASGGSSTSWSSQGWGSTSALKKDRTIINGKTVKLVFESENWKLYTNDVLYATITDRRVGTGTFDLSIGGTSGYSQSAGDQCYDMTISAIRIKTNPTGGN